MSHGDGYAADMPVTPSDFQVDHGPGHVFDQVVQLPRIPEDGEQQPPAVEAPTTPPPAAGGPAMTFQEARDAGLLRRYPTPAELTGYDVTMELYSRDGQRLKYGARVPALNAEKAAEAGYHIAHGLNAGSGYCWAFGPDGLQIDVKLTDPQSLSVWAASQQLLSAVDRVRDAWAEAGPEARTGWWQQMHEAAERLRDALEVSPADEPARPARGDGHRR